MGFLAMLCESVATVLPLHLSKDKLKYNDIILAERSLRLTSFWLAGFLGVHFRNESVHIHNQLL